MILKGNIATDIEVNTTQSGITRANFRIAVPRRFVDKGTGKRESDFINCVAWRQTADFISGYFVKGSQIMLEGSIQNRSYDAQDGSKRYITEVIVENAEFCGKREEKQQPAEQTGYIDVTDDENLPF